MSRRRGRATVQRPRLTLRATAAWSTDGRPLCARPTRRAACCKRIDVETLERYLAGHGRHKPARTDVETLQHRVEQLAQQVRELRDASALAHSPLETVVRDRDHYRADAATAKTVALQLVQASREARSGLIAAMEKQEDAFVQLLTPGSPEDLTLSRGKGS